MARYPGGKNSAGVFQRMINQIPPHEVYVEPFAGSASVFFHKLPARLSFLIDADPRVTRTLRGRIAGHPLFYKSHCVAKVVRANGIEWLSRLAADSQSFVYCDPPYLGITRRDPSRRIYRCEMTDAEEHERLLAVLLALPCNVMLSGYGSKLYIDRLKGWRTLTFRAWTRGGNSALEYLWFNYPEPAALHDYRYVGENYRKRQDFKRMRARWTKRLAEMPALKRYALMSALERLKQ